MFYYEKLTVNRSVSISIDTGYRAVMDVPLGAFCIHEAIRKTPTLLRCPVTEILDSQLILGPFLSRRQVNY